MRLTGFEAFADMRAAAPRLREAVAPRVERAIATAKPWLARALEIATPWAERAAQRLAPARAWLAAELAKSDTLMKVARTVSGAWMALVDAFCATIDPWLSRWYPDLRLVAVVTASGDIELNRTAKSDTSFLGSPEALDAEARAALAAARWSAVELRLRPDQVLQRTLSLPAASREYLGSIIEHKLERLTPWRPDRVLYGTRVADEEGAMLAVTLSATSKDLVAGPLAALAALGLTPTAIGIEGGLLTTPLAVNLLREAPRATRLDSRRAVSRIALATLAALGLVWLATSSVASSADDAAQLAGTRLMKARRLLKTASMGDIGERERALIEAKRPERAAVVLIDKLAAAIPADTYLKELTIAPDKVRLVGVTTNAPALVGEIEATGLANVRFTAAVTREKDGRDSFEVSADRPAPAADAEAP